MADKDKILITRKEVVEAQEFYADRTDKALKELQDSNKEAIFVPQLMDARIDAAKGTQMWTNWYCTTSIRATGRSKPSNISQKGGTPFVVYAHTQNHFSNPTNITTAIEQGLIHGAGIIPQEEFQRLLDLKDDEKVFVIDYETLRNSKSDVIAVKDALKHPQTTPFIGGTERAEAYLKSHQRVIGDQIGMYHTDDLADKPVGRLLFVGDDYVGSLGGDNLLIINGRFLGVPKDAQSTQQKNAPTQKQLMHILDEFVAPDNRDSLTERLARLYQ